MYTCRYARRQCRMNESDVGGNFIQISDVEFLKKLRAIVFRKQFRDLSSLNAIVSGVEVVIVIPTLISFHFPCTNP